MPDESPIPLSELHRRTPPAGGSVVTIGNFDGVHRGHAEIMHALRREADTRGARAAVITFDPHPIAIIAPDRAPPRLTTWRERAALLRDAGAADVWTLASEAPLFRLTAAEFIHTLVRALAPRAFVEGESFRFGAGRGGSIETLAALGRELGFEVCAAPLVSGAVDGVAVSSTAVRAYLAEGDVAQAASLLGRAHRITGVVVRGDARGRTIGFPTANVAQIEQVIPGFGVYAAVAQTRAALHACAVNVGPQPTFGQTTPRVEAHLLDFNGELVDERIGLHFVQRLRAPRRFAGVAELVAQIEHDVRAVRELLPMEAGGAPRVPADGAPIRAIPL
ncbi:MAG: bifunctional riboflavin kinase/FAD synthetase [Planctomycetia bacterium]|nr:MAG: bifunctional riboflavin kinase/FAD synthetase [Planctomycetia bacterium]